MPCLICKVMQVPLARNSTGPHPHPAALSILSWGGRVGVRAGAEFAQNPLAFLREWIP